MEETGFIYHPWLMWIPLLPLIGAVLNGILAFSLPKDFDVVHGETGKRIRGFVSLVACGTMAISFIIALVAFIGIVQNGYDAHGHTVYDSLRFDWFTWFSAGDLTVDVGLLMDPLSGILALVVTGVGFLIHVYSTGYMSHDRSFVRYFAYLNFFCFAMLMLILGDSLPVLFLGWEGVGVASYLLIGFWFTDEAKAAAGKKAFIVNRVGDFAFILAMFLLFNLVGSLDIAEIREWVSTISYEQLFGAEDGGGGRLYFTITLICILLFIGCTGKSAQIPLFTWLPDAMAGPTPVSALIHAATMVTAGVYLCTRMNFLFVLSPTTMSIIAVVGLLTAFFAATIGLTQWDIKKVLAYSTVSQLGYMFLAVGTGSFFAAIFHLMTHAFFKALLFLGSGSVIHGMHDEQDIRKMGGLKEYMPATRMTFLIGCMAIAGVPLFSGFFSKDEILWYTLSNFHVWGVSFGPVLWVVAVLTAGMTAFYMFRLYFLTFEGECRADEETKKHIHESPRSMTVPLWALAVLAMIGGFVGIPHILPGPNLMHDFLHNTIAPGEMMFAHEMGDGMAWVSMLIATSVGLGGIFLAYTMYGKKSDTPAAIAEKLGPVYRLVYDKYRIDELYDFIIVRPVRRIGVFCHRVVDDLLIDGAMVHGAAHAFTFGGLVLRNFQNGNLQRYVVYVLLGLAIILWLM